jgi:hypothetical protein
MTCAILTTALTRVTLVELLRDGPRHRTEITDALIHSGATTSANYVDKSLSRAVAAGAIVRVRPGWYGPAPVEIVPTLSEQVYTALEANPGATGRELAAAMGRQTRKDRARVYHTLAELEALGWARKTDERPARWYVEEA